MRLEARSESMATLGDVPQGYATPECPVMADLLASDTGPLEAALTEVGNYMPAPRRIPLSRFFDPSIAKLEMEHVWKKCWQVVGREEDIPEVGDRKPYDVGDLSYVIIRSAPDEFRALQNACLHRGTRLCSIQTSGETIRCPFHAWEWNLDGSLKNIPSRWDFPDAADQDYHLPEALIDRWGGYLFINPDRNAAPLQASLGLLTKHFEKRDGEDRFTISGFRKKLRCNWKLAQDAFFEAYHLFETHPGAKTFAGDTATQIDIWQSDETQISRLITPIAVPSCHSNGSRLAAAEATMTMFGKAHPDVPPGKITSVETSRSDIAQWRRENLGNALGVDLSKTSDSYMLDSIQYFMFPNFWPWLGEGLPLYYQFLPYGDNPNECIVEFRLTAPVPDQGPRPPAAVIQELDFDDSATTTNMGFIATVFDEDFSNLPLVQRGLRSTLDPNATITLGRYQEARITAFYEVLDRKLGLKSAGPASGPVP